MGFGGVLKSESVKLLGKNYTPVTGTALLVTEELLHSFEVKSKLVLTDDYLEFYMLPQWNNTAGQKIYKVYFSPTASLADVNKKQVATATGTTNTSTPLTRRFVVKSDTVVRSHNPAVNNIFLIDVALAGSNVPTDITVPSMSAGFYVLISGQKIVGTDTESIDYSFLIRRRQ